MIPSGDESSRIVRYSQDSTCGTGETTYECVDGSVWKAIGPFDREQQTGRTLGTVCDGKIYRRPNHV